MDSGNNLPTAENWRDSLADFDWKPTREEVLVNSIIAISEEIDLLSRKKAEYEQELEELGNKNQK